MGVSAHQVQFRDVLEFRTIVEGEEPPLNVRITSPASDDMTWPVSAYHWDVLLNLAEIAPKDCSNHQIDTVSWCNHGWHKRH